MQSWDVLIAGAGVVGMACALELHRRGVRVAVVDRGLAGGEASSAAAGMLAAHDPENPAELQHLAELSIALYPEFLDNLQHAGGGHVPFETAWTLEKADGWSHGRSTLPQLRQPGFRRIAEHSLDPRKLAFALAKALRSAGVPVLEKTPVQAAQMTSSQVLVKTPAGTLGCARFLDCTGAWSSAPVYPVKGQMLRVHAPGVMGAGALGNVVVRTPEIYLVPRRNGSVVIGATVEDADFSKTVLEEDIARLRAQAAALIPVLQDAPELERWAGLRPGTPDRLPLLGAVADRAFVAAGHYRNGILLAPGTARVMAQVLMDEPAEVALAAFAPGRFAAVPAG